MSRLENVLIRVMASDGTTHLWYPTARRTLCLDHRPEADVDNHVPLSCEICRDTELRIAVNLATLKYKTKEPCGWRKPNGALCERTRFSHELACPSHAHLALAAQAVAA